MARLTILQVVGLYLVVEAVGSIVWFWAMPNQELFHAGRVVRIIIGIFIYRTLTFIVRGTKY